MAKNPNRNPNKGFLRELASKPEKPKGRESFTWNKHVATDGKAEGMKTAYRMSRFSSAKEGTSTLCEEHRKHTDDRKKK